MSNNVITVEKLSKRYLVGHREQRQYTTFREMLTREAKNFARKAIDLAHGREIVQGDELEEFWALKDISFEVQKGHVLGIIGRNGAGKTTLLKVLSRITEPTEGRVTMKGRVASLLEVGTGFHPELTGRENVYLNGAILGMSRAEIKRRFDEIVAFAEVEKFLDTPVKRYSSGMYVRLAFAVAAHLEPEILIVDEVLAVGDAQFQKKCLGKMQQVSGKGGRTVIFVSHNMSAIRELCPRAVLLNAGKVERDGPSARVIENYFSTVSASADMDLLQVVQNGAKRWSRLHSLRLLSREYKPVTSVLMGEPLIAQILVEITRFTRQVEVGLKMSSRYGVAVHYFTSSWEMPAPDLEPGFYWFEVKVPAIYLFPGLYLLGAWTSSPGEVSDASVQEVGSLTVLKANLTRYPNRIQEYSFSGSEVYSPSEWTYAPATQDAQQRAAVCAR